MLRRTTRQDAACRIAEMLCTAMFIGWLRGHCQGQSTGQIDHGLLPAKVQAYMLCSIAVEVVRNYRIDLLTIRNAQSLFDYSDELASDGTSHPTDSCALRPS